MASLEGRRVLCFVGDDYEDLELWYPKLRLEEAGAHVILAGVSDGATYKGKHGYPCMADVALSEMDAADFHGVICPGGWMPDKLRRDPNVLELLQAFDASRKLIAAICHGGWMPISAGIYRGVKVTGSPGIKDDLINAGAHYVDEPVVVDHNLITSRVPDDLPMFCQAIVAMLTD